MKKKLIALIFLMIIIMGVIYITLTGAFEKSSSVTVSYAVHIQNLGDSQGYVENGVMAGTSGESKRLEAIRIVIKNKGRRAPKIKYEGVDASNSNYKEAFISDMEAGTEGIVDVEVSVNYQDTAYFESVQNGIHYIFLPSFIENIKDTLITYQGDVQAASEGVEINEQIHKLVFDNYAGKNNLNIEFTLTVNDENLRYIIKKSNLPCENISLDSCDISTINAGTREL